jgi:hypothetical protein
MAHRQQMRTALCELVFVVEEKHVELHPFSRGKVQIVCAGCASVQ